MRPKRVLVLFPSVWDRRHFSSPKYRGRFEFIFYDRELWTFPGGFFRILCFNPIAYIDKVVRDASRLGIDGVLSADEYVGAIIAAAVAQRMGLPGHDPALVIQATHKYYARTAQRQIMPEAVPDFQLMPVPPPPLCELEVGFPMFVKPVRGSFSIFTARCDSYRSLTRHLDLSAAWRIGLRSVLRPFNDLLRHFTGYDIDVNRFIGESLMQGHQVCIDGYVHDGEVHFLGIVDERVFPGTHAFERFVYPSQLPEQVQCRVRALCTRLVKGLGLEQGQFNVELFHDPTSDALRLIEFHPRISYQFADLYEDVDGMNTYDVLLDLTVGNQPRIQHGAGRHTHSASLVLRKFHGRRVVGTPSAASIHAFKARHASARVVIFARKGSTNPEMRALGSYRCALVNVGASSIDELHAIRRDADASIRFEMV